MRKSKRHIENLKKVEKNKLYSVEEAIKLAGLKKFLNEVF